jgi:hypothetical protein
MINTNNKFLVSMSYEYYNVSNIKRNLFELNFLQRQKEKAPPS